MKLSEKILRIRDAKALEEQLEEREDKANDCTLAMEEVGKEKSLQEQNRRVIKRNMRLVMRNDELENLLKESVPMWENDSGRYEAWYEKYDDLLYTITPKK